MSDIEEIKKNLNEHEKRLCALESIMKSPKKEKIVKGKNSLPNFIMGLKNEGFFSEPRTSEEVHKKLQQKYHCEPNRVAMALLRLAKSKQLRKTTKIIGEKGYKAYVW